MKHSYLLTAKTTQNVNIFYDVYMVWKSYCRQSLYVRSNFLCLFMASVKLMQYVYVT